MSTSRNRNYYKIIKCGYKKNINLIIAVSDNYTTSQLGRSTSALPYNLPINCFGIRQPSLGGRGRLPFGEGEMSVKPTEGYGPVGRVSGG